MATSTETRDGPGGGFQKAHVMHAVIQPYWRCGITPDNHAENMEGSRYRSKTMTVLDDLWEELQVTEPALAEAMGLSDFGPMRLFYDRENVVCFVNRISLVIRKDATPL